MATVQIFSSAAGDGGVRYQGSFAGTWADCRSGTGGTPTALPSTVRTTVQSDNGVSAGVAYLNSHVHLVFDLASNVPSGATITGATLSTYVYALTTGAGGSVGLVASTQASASNLTTSDYTAVGSTEFITRVNFTSLSTGAYKDWTLNASGVSHLVSHQADNAMLAFRTSFDLDNSAPGSSTVSYMGISLSDQTGTSEDPYITVTYTPAAAGAVQASPSRRTRGLYTR